jgi:GAF domain-containing protein
VAGPRQHESALTRFARDVGRAIAIDLTKAGVYFVGGTLLAAFALLVWRGGSVPAWSALLAVVLVLAVGLGVRARSVGYAAALVRHEEYAAHVAEALDALQRIVSGEIAVAVPHYIEAGVLGPARDLIVDKPAEDVRLSVLLPRADGERWRMPWAVGHSLTGAAKYEERIVDTVSRHAYESGEAQHWPDTSTDSGFRQNPMASYVTRSMISVPIRRADRTVGVFNVVSSEPNAFDRAEETYLASLGAVIAVAIGLFEDGRP